MGESFLRTYADEEGKSFKSISPNTQEMMLDYHWPGNIRELQNIIRKACVVHDGDELEAHMLQLKKLRQLAKNQDYQLVGLAAPQAAVTPNQSLKTTVTIDIHQPMAVIERDIIEAVIASCKGSVPKASQILQLSPSTIYRKREAWQQIEGAEMDVQSA